MLAFFSIIMAVGSICLYNISQIIYIIIGKMNVYHDIYLCVFIMFLTALYNFTNLHNVYPQYIFEYSKFSPRGNVGVGIPFDLQP